jgi:ribosomal protein S30
MSKPDLPPTSTTKTSGTTHVVLLEVFFLHKLKASIDRELHHLGTAGDVEKSFLLTVGQRSTALLRTVSQDEVGRSHARMEANFVRWTKVIRTYTQRSKEQNLRLGNLRKAACRAGTVRHTVPRAERMTQGWLAPRKRRRVKHFLRVLEVAET